MVFERSKISSKKEKRAKLGLRLCSMHEHYKHKISNHVAMSQIIVDNSGCNFIKFDGSQCCGKTVYRTETTLYVRALNSSIMFSDNKTRFFFKYHNISKRQFENFIRFNVLMLQSSTELLKGSVQYDEVNATIGLVFEDPELSQINVNASYFFEKMNNYFSFVRNDTPIETRVKNLIKLDIFTKNFFFFLRDNAYRVSAESNDHKAYIVFIIIMKTMMSHTSHNTATLYQTFSDYLSKELTFHDLKNVFETMFCPIQNTTESYIRIHALLEQNVDKLSRKIILKSLSENESVDKICWH